MSISRPLRRRNSPLQEAKTFWLHFQVCHDGLTPPPPPPPPSPSSSQITNPPPTIPTTFPLFPTLPSELRLNIWSHLLQPRIVIAACFESDPDATARKHAQLVQRANLPRCPVLLHICAETRALALAHYELAFSWRIPGILATPCSSPSRVWFNFATDTLLLLGELEPYDSSNINAPMVYFFSRADAHRVRNVACAFEELRLGEMESEQIFGCLFHILDGFPGAERLLITSTDEDLARATEGRGGMSLDFGLGMRENIVQKIWWGWINGTSVVTSRMRDKQILMVREDGLANLVAEQAAI